MNGLAPATAVPSVSCSVWVTLSGINKVNSVRAEAVCSAQRMWVLPALVWQPALGGEQAKG